ncbi:thioredoxin domain-containing protein [Sphingomonas sp. AR_OL41]|jgi:protein-disulfide isomerase|uniref:thioredoxin domain-containing protein n=1 Tax=Sphingomonas sp. AR_OL41 TaxID=3042729 RepID=UPI0024818157|nr:thioredoxin domain-containing protein [Sphingomonas sp. AR_OL41]MDH7975844.1 thioredoxin domain-containing protein [Sphingomonas sp. AR_OL41]
MKFVLVLAALPALLLAACGSGGSTGSGNDATAAAAVAAVKPPAGTSWLDTVTATPEGGYVQGNPNAAVKLIEYGSRLCPVCGRFAQEGVPALRAGPIAAGKLSYEFRDYPIHGAPDLGPAVLGHCVAPAAFFPMLDQMFAAQEQLLAKEEAAIKVAQAAPNATPVQIGTTFAENMGYIDFVKQRGVTEAAARACLSDPKNYELIATRKDAADEKYKVSGTPTFIVNGTVAADVFNWEGLQPVLRTAGAL